MAGGKREVSREPSTESELMKMTSASTYLLSVCALATVAAGAGPAKSEKPATGTYLEAVKTFADNVLRHGRDVYGPKRTPLFTDGLNIDTHEPVIWKLPREQAEKWNMPAEWTLSNLASQQNLFRVLVALTDLTGDPKYKQAAVEATRYALDHLRHENGLLFWGGHAAWDLATDQPVGEGRTNGIAGKHEFKSSYPFYELMWEVDKQATRKFIESFWASHILRWDILDMNRHGAYLPIPDQMWEQEYVGGPVPCAGQGLTFFLTGSDLFYAAAMLHELDGDPRPLVWAKRMAQRYADARHPVTGLGADNYSIIEPDRMTRQFGAEFGDRFTEATVTSLYGNRYNRSAICQLKLAERLGAAGEEFKRWAVGDLTAYARHAYDASDNSFWATLIDGTKLTPADRKRNGYVEVRWLEKRPADGLHFWAYALAYKLSRDPLMWQTARNIGRGLGIGDIGATPDPSIGVGRTD
jgi:pectate lyase